jgi:uncharacterized protein YoxC
MSSDNTEPNLKNLEKKVDALTKEIEGMRKDLETLSEVAGNTDKVDGLASEIEEMKEVVTDSTRLDALTSKVDEVEASIDEMKSSKEMEVIFKKLDDILVGITDLGSKIDDTDASASINTLTEQTSEITSSLGEITSSLDQVRESDSVDTLGKRIDDLQQYIAGLSALEEKIADMSTGFTETKEIVGIIVRQLDDIERKYNKAIEDISDAMAVVKTLVDSGAIEVVSKKPERVDKSRPEPEESGSASIHVSASTIDELMNKLLGKVKPTTEAKEMAKSLEEIRDKLTLMIEGQTPVLYQFGRRAQELKAYPPTATLNENDIARLNKEIRDWTSKLKKIVTEE